MPMLAHLRAFIDRWHQLKTVAALTDRDLDDRAHIDA